jgi:hypothetical protein
LVQALPSSAQGSVLLVKAQPVDGLQASVVHGLLSLQLSGVPVVQAPAWQVSAPLQTLPSLHEMPFGAATCWQVPALQESVVHGLPSSHCAAEVQPLQPAIAVCRQPATGSQESVVHGSLSLQVSALPGAQLPAWQVSAPSQTLPSLHAVPLAFGGWVQVPLLQTSLVQALPSLHAVPLAFGGWVQVPLLQTSLVQALPSSAQGFVLLVKTQPAVGLQESVVHGLLSLQMSGAPALQAPAWQVSAPLQMSASAHEVPLALAGWVQVPPPQTSSVQRLPSSVQGSVLLLKTQPAVGLQESVVHGLLSLQVSGVPAVQAPA